MKWKPFKGGIPYTCKDCPGYIAMRVEADKWRGIAAELADNVGLSTAASNAKEKYMQAVLSE